MKNPAIALLSIALVGCGIQFNSPSVESVATSEPASTENALPESVVSTPEPLPDATSSESAIAPSENSVTIAENGAGLGDDRSSFEKLYPPNFSGEGTGRYQDDYLVVNYLNNKAYQIGIQFSKKFGGNRVSIDEAIAAASPLLPSDAVKVGEWEYDSRQYVVHFQSEKLANVVFSQDGDQEWLWGGATPGSIVIVLDHDEYMPQLVFGASISPGNPDEI